MVLIGSGCIEQTVGARLGLAGMGAGSSRWVGGISGATCDGAVVWLCPAIGQGRVRCRVELCTHPRSRVVRVQPVGDVPVVSIDDECCP
eukprot:4881922-Pyramimonas_sp.AAC.1